MLTIEQQKRLTEFLGEEFHRSVGGGQTGTKCVCGGWWSSCFYQTRLDFSDWRVVGRLIEKMRSHILENHGDFFELAIHDQEIVGHIEKAMWCSNPQLAICLAIDSYLKEREGKCQQ